MEKNARITILFEGQIKEGVIAMKEQDMEILKTDTCPTLSGRSTLSYDIGCNKELTTHFRVFQNSGKGLHCKKWASLEQIETNLLKEAKPFTSRALAPIFTGKSSNSAGFLLAVLKNEGLIAESDEERNSYRICDATGFRSMVGALIQAKAGEKSNMDVIPKEIPTESVGGIRGGD